MSAEDLIRWAATILGLVFFATCALGLLVLCVVLVRGVLYSWRWHR